MDLQWNEPLNNLDILVILVIVCVVTVVTAVRKWSYGLVMLVIFVSVLAGTCLFLVPFFLGIMRPPTWRVYSGDGHMYIFNYINNIFKARATHVMHHFSASRYMDLRSASRSMSLHLSALVALSCTTSAQVATWPSTAPIASCRFNSLSALAAHAPLHSL